MNSCLHHIGNLVYRYRIVLMLCGFLCCFVMDVIADELDDCDEPLEFTLPTEQIRTAQRPPQCFYKVIDQEFDPVFCGYSSTIEGFTLTNNFNDKSTLKDEELEVGIHTITWTSKINGEDFQTETITVIIKNRQAPRISSHCTSPEYTDFEDGVGYFRTDDGKCYATKTIPAPRVIVLCGKVKLLWVVYFDGIQINNGEGDVTCEFPIGESTVVYTAIDDAGDKSESCEFTVLVKDKEAPTIHYCYPSKIYFTALNDSCYYPETFSITATDNCTPEHLLIYNVIVDGIDQGRTNEIKKYKFPVGSTKVIFTVEDAYGNVTKCEFEVVVEDKQDPVAICKHNIPPLILDVSTGSATLNVIDIDGGSWDNCGLDELSLDRYDFDCRDVGKVHTVKLTVWDLSRNQHYCETTVTVEYNEVLNPPLILPENVICSGDEFKLNLTHPDFGSLNWSWSWEVTKGTISIGTGTSNTIINTFTNTTDDVEKVIFVITPTIRYPNPSNNRCPLDKIEREILVNPEPKLQLETHALSICNKDGFSIQVETISKVSQNAEIHFEWIAPPNSIGTPGSGIVPSSMTQTLNNSSTNDQEVAYTLIPSLHLKNRLEGCISKHRETVTITVMPTPVITISPIEETVCNGEAINFAVNSNNIISLEKGTWSSNLLPPEIVSGISIIGTIPSLMRGTTFDQTITNSNNDGQILKYTFTPRIEMVQNGKFCDAPENNVTVPIRVNPTPKITADIPYRTQLCYNEGFMIGLESLNNIVFESLGYNLEVEYDTNEVINNLINPLPAYNFNQNKTINQQEFQNESDVPQVVTYIIYPFIEINSTRKCLGDSIKKTVRQAPEVKFDLVPKTFAGGKNISCFGFSDGEIEIKNLRGGWAAKGYNYDWSENVNADNITTVITALSAGEYSITVSDKVIGCKKYKEIILTQPDLLMLLPPNIVNSDCKFSDGSITVIAAGGTQPYTYYWDGPGGFKYSGEKSSFPDLKTGYYTITITDINGCEIKTEPPYHLRYNIDFDVLHIGGWRESTYGAYHISCFGADDGELSPNIYPHEASSYKWEHNGKIFKEADAPVGNFFSSTYHDFKITNLSPGEYKLTIINSFGCELVSQTFKILQPDSITLNLETVNMSCHPGNDGFIKANVAGGTQRFTYQWSNGQTNESITGLPKGEYKVTVTDSNGCSKTDSTEISIPPPLKVNAVVESDFNGYHIDCYDNNTGKIALNIQNGRGEYIYIWSTGETTDRLENVKAGIYSVTVTDGFNCTGNETVTLIQPNPLNEGQSFITHVTCSGEDSGRIQAKVEGGVEPYHYYWTSYAGDSPNADYLPAGAYQLQVIDSNGCNLDFSTFTIAEPEGFKVDFKSIEAFCPEMNDGEIQATVSGGTKPYTYQWKEIAWGTSDNVADLRPGVYSLEVTDANSCRFTAKFELGYRYVECLRIPNAFSPNDDGFNDRWEISVGDPNSTSRNLLREMYPDVIVEVYSGNWGMLLYRSQKGYPEPWDGKYKGKYLSVNSYVYRIILNNNTKPITGNVTIIR